MTPHPPSVHLANQHDKVCIRTELNYCGIYYSPITMGVGGYPTSATLATAIAVGYSGTSCTTDYLTIPNGLGVNPAPSTAYTSNQVNIMLPHHSTTPVFRDPASHISLIGTYIKDDIRHFKLLQHA